MKMQSLVSKECDKVQDYSKKIKECSKVLLEQIEKIHGQASREKNTVNVFCHIDRVIYNQ